MAALTRRPSPRLCQACLRLHVRLPSDVRQERREDLELSLARAPSSLAYALELFDHLTLSVKAVAPDEVLIHPAPRPPREWGARALRLIDDTVVRVAFDL